MTAGRGKTNYERIGIKDGSVNEVRANVDMMSGCVGSVDGGVVKEGLNGRQDIGKGSLVMEDASNNGLASSYIDVCDDEDPGGASGWKGTKLGTCEMA